VVTHPPERRGDDGVHRITDARRSHSDDQHARIVKYSVSMAIRAVCLILAFVVTGPMRWVFIAGAITLPYVAVVIANAGREQTPRAPEAWTTDGQPRELGPAPAAPAPPGEDPATEP
jgi:Protein of unknown function (DUF3099)